MKREVQPRIKMILDTYERMVNAHRVLQSLDNSHRNKAKERGLEAELKHLEDGECLPYELFKERGGGHATRLTTSPTRGPEPSTRRQGSRCADGSDTTIRSASKGSTCAKTSDGSDCAWMISR